MVMETRDLILGKAKYEDWESMYHNVWSRPETAEYMAWTVTADGQAARERMRRTITWQENHHSWLVYEKNSGQAVGFAGIEEFQPNIWQDTGIALGPEFVGRGYGKQILELLMEYCISLGGTEFYYSARSGNSAAKALALSCGFIPASNEPSGCLQTFGDCREGQQPRCSAAGLLTFQYAERKTDLRSRESYKLEIYRKDLKDIESV